MRTSQGIYTILHKENSRIYNYSTCIARSAGGGNLDEGELIEVIEMSIEEAKEYMQRDDVLSPGGFLFALSWFFRLKDIK